ETPEAAPRGGPARQAPAGIEAARVQADDLSPERRQGTGPHRRDPAAAGRGEEAGEVPGGERGRQEAETGPEGGAGPGGRRPSAGVGAGGEGPVGARPDDDRVREERRLAERGGPGPGGVDRKSTRLNSSHLV